MNMRKLMAVAVIAASATLPMAANAEAKSVRLVCNSYTGSTPLTNFQALVKLSATDDAYGFSYSEAGGASATNIWFTSADGSAVYPHEIDTWDTLGDSFVWVKIPTLTNGTEIVMHWSDDASDVQSASGNVWTNFVGVWHMNESGANPEPDSTGNGLSAVPGGTTSEMTSSDNGKVGKGRINRHSTGNYSKNGFKVSDYKNKISNGTKFSISGWWKAYDTSTTQNRFASGCVGTGDTAITKNWWDIAHVGSDYTKLIVASGTGTSAQKTVEVSIPSCQGTWEYITVVYDGASVDVYANGERKGGSTSLVSNGHGDYFSIGNVNAGVVQRGFRGDFDEVRMYNGVLSADRVAADYATMNDPTTFLVAVSDDTIVTATWTGNAGDGDVSNSGNWTCYNNSGSVVSGGLPGAATAVTVSGDSLDFQVPASATFEYNTLTFGDCTLGRSCDWTGLGDVAIPSGATIDLKGHALFVQGLTGGGVITNTANAAYTTLDYIQANNNNASQYIITDYTPRYSDTFVTKVNFQNIVNQCIYCARGNGVASGSYSCLTYTNNKLRFDHVNSQGGESITPPTDADCTLIVNGKAGACKLNGTLIEKNMATASDDTATAASVLSFFVLNNSASGTAMSTYRQANFKMYYFRIYDVDGEIVRDYVPAKNGSGVAGLWERVHGTFWASNGGTAFVAGGETNRGEVVFCGTGVWSGVEIAPAVAVVKEDFGGTLTRSGLLKPGMSGAGTASFVFNNGTATLSDGIQAGTAEFNVYGGTVNVPNFIDWGKRAGKTAVWNQYGGDVTQSGGNFWIGAYGASGAVGIYNLYGGTLTKSGNILTLGQDPGHTGYFNMTNGTLTCNVDIDVGENGVGHFTLSGGTLNEITSFRVGRNRGSVGTFGQSGGAATVKSYLQIGAEEGSTGTYTMTAGTLGVPNQPIAVGRYGTGTLDVSGAAVVTAAKGVRVGFTNGANVGSGTLVVTNGGTIATSSIYAGGTAAAQASVLFDGATVKATAAGDILKDLQDVTIGADGLALNVQTYAAVVTNTTLKVTSGTTAITMAGTGSLDLSKATVELSSTPTGKFTLAVATGNGTFIGVPAVVGAGGATVNGYRACLSSDGKSVEVRRRGFMILVK